MTTSAWWTWGRRGPLNQLPLAVIGFLALSRLVPASEPKAPPEYSNHAQLLEVRTADDRVLPVKTLADWAVRRDHILGHLERVMGPFPGPERRTPMEVEEVEVVDEPRFLRKRVRFRAEPGDRVTAWLLLPKGAKPEQPRPGALCLHQTTAIGKDEPVGLGGLPNLKYARELAERGYAVIAPDYPNFGESKVDVYALGYASASMKAVWNNLRAVDLLTSLPGVDGTRVGVIGHSLGGHNAIFTALFDPRLKVVVSSCGFNSFPYYYGGNIAGWSHRGYMPRLKDVFELDLRKVPFDFPELIGALAPRAFFTNSPLHDANFAVEGVKACLTSARPVYELFGAADRLRAEFPDAGHDFPPSVREAAYAFMDLHLKPAR